MSEHTHPAEDYPATVPTHDEIADRTHDNYVKQACPHGQFVANWPVAAAESMPTTVISDAHAEPVDKFRDEPATMRTSYQNHHALAIFFFSSIKRWSRSSWS
jgi:hypothetical protein